MPLFALIDRWRAPPPKPRRVDWIHGQLFAHRGLHGPGVPENSAAAFAAAVSRGLGIELDVQRTSDGLVVVFHDFELDRMTAETGPVARHSAEQLRSIALSGTTEMIPTLREALDLVGGKVPLLVEIKTRRETRVPALCLSVRRVLEGYLGPHAVISFDPRVARWFARHSPLTVRGLTITEDSNLTLAVRIKRRLALWHARPDIVCYDLRDLPSRFAAAQRRRGLPLVTWTAHTAEQRAKAADLADAVIAEGGGIA